MKIENQVCTLEQAKKLKALGIAQESFLYWEELHPLEGCATERLQVHFNTGHPISNSVVKESYSAYTVAELHAMIPETFYIKGTTNWLTWESAKRAHGRVDVSLYKNGRTGAPGDDEPAQEVANFGYTPFASSLAELLIWLLEKEYASADEVNQLLKAA